MTGDEVLSLEVSLAGFWSLQANEAVITFRRHSKEFRGIKDIFLLPLFLSNNCTLNVQYTLLSAVKLCARVLAVHRTLILIFQHSCTFSYLQIQV